MNLDQRLSEEAYRKELKSLQKALPAAAVRLYRKKRSVVLVFEGKDAAGKGGAIRRLTGGLIPELYRVIPIGAPEPSELARHYLWRFWRQLPAPGRLAIFDRSWYGRVLVERVEGFAQPAEWTRAYREINEMEAAFTRAGMPVAKFWLQIDQEEQARRFEERAKSPLKQWKFTDEDVRNREKWPQYEAAVNEMFAQTNQKNAPWHLIAANDKRFARIRILRTVLELMERA
ncbi:MAG: UDP-galactose-lipid carrier transferase [Leptospirales bacterium]